MFSCRTPGCTVEVAHIGNFCTAHLAMYEVILRGAMNNSSNAIASQIRPTHPLPKVEPTSRFMCKGDASKRVQPTLSYVGQLYWVYMIDSNMLFSPFPYMLIDAGNKLRLVNIRTGRLLSQDKMLIDGVYLIKAANSAGEYYNG